MRGSTVGRTVARELLRRKGCRYGLAGLRVRVKGQRGKRYVVQGSAWDRDSKLVLSLLPEGMSAHDGHPEDVKRRLEEDRQAGRLQVLSMADVARWRPPPGYLRHVPASAVVLLEDWPVVCTCWVD